MTSVIEVHDLTKRYRETLTVDDVSFSIEENTICGLLGLSRVCFVYESQIATCPNR